MINQPKIVSWNSKTIQIWPTIFDSSFLLIRNEIHANSLKNLLLLSFEQRAVTLKLNYHTNLRELLYLFRIKQKYIFHTNRLSYESPTRRTQLNHDKSTRNVIIFISKLNCNLYKFMTPPQSENSSGQNPNSQRLVRTLLPNLRYI